MNRETADRIQEELDRILAEAERPEMLGEPLPYYQHEYSKYPDRLRVSFADGSTAIYDLRVNQPAPVIVENIRIIRKWKQGYVNQPYRRHRKK